MAVVRKFFARLIFFFPQNIVTREFKLEDQKTDRLFWSVMRKWPWQSEVSDIDLMTQSSWMAVCTYKVFTSWAEPQEHTLEHKTRLCGPCYVRNILYLISSFLAREGWIMQWESLPSGNKTIQNSVEPEAV